MSGVYKEQARLALLELFLMNSLHNSQDRQVFGIFVCFV